MAQMKLRQRCAQPRCTQPGGLAAFRTPGPSLMPGLILPIHSAPSGITGRKPTRAHHFRKHQRVITRELKVLPLQVTNCQLTRVSQSGAIDAIPYILAISAKYVMGLSTLVSDLTAVSESVPEILIAPREMPFSTMVRYLDRGSLNIWLAHLPFSRAFISTK